MTATLAVSAPIRLLVVAPHPDDETLGSGLLIQQVLAAGGEVAVLLLTDGDNNPWPQRWSQRRWQIDPAARAGWGVRRRGEVLRAMARLGLPESALIALGWPDLGLTRLLKTDFDQVMTGLRAALQSFQPDWITCPALADRHPDHGAAHVMTRLALHGWAAEVRVLAYPVHGGGEADHYPLTVAPGAGQQALKLSALNEHGSQMLLSAGRMRAYGSAPECYVDTVRTSPDGVLPWRPSALVRPFLRLTLVGPGGVQDLPWPNVGLQRNASGGWTLPPEQLALVGPWFAKLHLDWPSPWIFDHWGWHAL